MKVQKIEMKNIAKNIFKINDFLSYAEHNIYNHRNKFHEIVLDMSLIGGLCTMFTVATEKLLHGKTKI